MKLTTLLHQAVKLLRKENCEFAVCGGIAAMVYRPEPRFTGDIDFIISKENGTTADIAIQIIEHFGLKPNKLRTAQLSPAPGMNKKTSPIAVIVGRSENDKNKPGLDFLLPCIPWVKTALVRAQNNLINIDNDNIPFITAEDVIIAKLSSFSTSHRYAKDLDDLLSIINCGRDLDFGYLAERSSELKLFIPKHLESQFPKALSVTLKRIRIKNKALK